VLRIYIYIYDEYTVCEASFLLWDQNDRVPHLREEVRHVVVRRTDKQ